MRATSTTDDDTVSWQRKNSIVDIPQGSVDLVQDYHEFLSQQVKEQDASKPSHDKVLQRTRRVAAAAATNDFGAAEYRCLETGGFLLPTVSFHPSYKSLLAWRNNSLEPSDFCVLDLGCGLAADGRRMLLDGFATHLVAVDRSELYLKLGCEMFGEEPDRVVTTVARFKEDQEKGSLLGYPMVTFLAADVSAGKQAEEDDDDIIKPIQLALQRQKQQQQKDQEIIINAQQQKMGSLNMSNSAALPLFNAVYAGKFLHCLETKENLRIVLRRVWKLLSDQQGCLFGVYGRNYRPQFECASKEAFEKALVQEGFSPSLIEEEAGGATWFCAFKKNIDDKSAETIVMPTERDK
ncbi:expressed unknown protein [Seminavis robusta]|uniref:Methyltransferase domain-containing protein n=1 Tax=Seminavis robusta TaxID=568900 RepID=A0A9N8E772_9STRA|nr:expressed unknown protein [Seminavis robusta]|eukprot:Sro695_g188590.1 n/a (350) ;mRNA; r:3760-4809